MNDKLKFKIEDVVFDTVKCKVVLFCDTTDSSVFVHVLSHLSETDNSKKEWCDLTSYGQCKLVIEDFATLC